MKLTRSNIISMMIIILFLSLLSFSSYMYFRIGNHNYNEGIKVCTKTSEEVLIECQEDLRSCSDLAWETYKGETDLYSSWTDMLVACRVFSTTDSICIKDNRYCTERAAKSINDCLDNVPNPLSGFIPNLK